MTDDDRVANRKYLRSLTLGCVFLWLLAIATNALLVRSVPGCQLDAKGSPIDCGWATDLINLSKTVIFVLSPILVVAVPLIILVWALIWTWRLLNR